MHPPGGHVAGEQVAIHLQVRQARERPRGAPGGGHGACGTHMREQWAPGGTSERLKYPGIY